MRTLTGNTQTKVAQRLASEPITIIQINWSTGIEYYGDKTFTLDAHSIQGKVLECSPIQATGKQDTGGEVSSASITLDDTDGTLKVIWNTLIIEGTSVTVYHHYEGNAWADLTLIFKGKIGGSIEWNEGERKLSIDIESYIDDAEIGFAPAKNSITDMNNDVADVMWPIVFGGVLKIKGIAIKRGAIGNNIEGIYGGWPIYDSEPIKVENGSKFPQNISMYLVARQTIFYGHFDGDMFYRDISNINWYTNVAVDARTNDADVSNLSVCWIVTSENLAQKQVWLGEGLGFNFCVRQEGKKCWFQFPWNRALTTGDVFVEVAGCVNSYWYSDPTFLNWWYVKPGGQVTQYDKSYSDLYIVNQFPSTEIVEVFAWRTVAGNEVFSPVPSSYYTIHLNYSIAGKNVTAIEFPKPLYSYENENWKEDIYVSLRSTLSNNTADIIKWIIENYTSHAVDATSFANVKIDLGAYPSNFAIFQKKNVIDLIEEIAWQARCAIFIHNGVISIKYLSKSLPVDYTMTTTDILLKSLMLGFVPTEDIKTRLTTKWSKDYSGQDDMTNELIYTNNISAFGLRIEEREIYIYNIEELIKMSLYFWGYRYSNSWRTMQYPTLLRTLGIELFDCLAHIVPIMSTNMIRGIAEDVSHDSDKNEISIRTMLASRAGDHNAGQPIEDPYFWIGDPNYPVTPRTIVDPLDGRTIVDYVVPIVDPTGGGGGGGGGSVTYKFVFTQPTQTEVERGTNIPVTIQLFDSNDKRVYNTITAKLSLTSLDSADRLTTNVVEKTITLTNGEYIATTEQITGGTTVVPEAYLACVDSQQRPEYSTGTSTHFSICNVKGSVLTWSVQPPATVRRGTLFSLTVTGGIAGEVIKVWLRGCNAGDKLKGLTNDTNGTITLGVGGTWSTTGARIEGGTGAVTAGYLQLEDVTYHKYANANSTPFNISGTAGSITVFQSLVHSVVLTQQNAVNQVSLFMDSSVTYINNNEAFDIYAAVELADGNVDTSFNGQLTLEAYDNYGNKLQWLEPQAASQVTLNFVNGVMDQFGFKISIPDGAVLPINIQGKTTYTNGSVLTNWFERTSELVQELIQEITFSQVVANIPVPKEYRVEVPINITRGVSFNVTITAMKTDGTRDTAYVPQNATLTPTSSDVGDITPPVSILNASWSTGQVVVAYTLTGGAGADTLNFQVADEFSNYVGNSPTIGVGLSSTIITPDYWRATWLGQDGWGTGDESSLNGALSVANVAMQGATKVVSTATVGLASTAYHGGNVDWEYAGGDRAIATAQIVATRYTISDPQKAGALSLRLQLKVMGAVGYPDQYIVYMGTRTAQGTHKVGYSATEPNNYADLVANQIQAGLVTCYGGYVSYSEGGYGTGPMTYLQYATYDHVPPPYVSITEYVDVDIPVSFLRTMPGNKLYVWALRPTITLAVGSGRPRSDGGHTGSQFVAGAGCETYQMTINA